MKVLSSNDVELPFYLEHNCSLHKQNKVKYFGHGSRDLFWLLLLVVTYKMYIYINKIAPIIFNIWVSAVGGCSGGLVGWNYYFNTLILGNILKTFL